MWLTISSRGILKQLFSNKFKYLYQRVLRKNHSDFNYLFWPDFPGYDYSKETIEWVEDNLVFVFKPLNPPNVPQARRIKKLRGDLEGTESLGKKDHRPQNSFG